MVQKCPVDRLVSRGMIKVLVKANSLLFAMPAWQDISILPLPLELYCL